jgi:uncharacterized protein YecA (UPF0149 family)
MRSPAFSPAGTHGRYAYATAVLSVFWPESQYRALIARWPHLADEVGGSWDEHRRNVERYRAVVEREGLAVNQVAADLRDFEAFLAARRVTTPTKDDLTAYPDARDASAVWVAWPPDRTAACWCGSGRKYKQCCRPYGLGSLD